MRLAGYYKQALLHQCCMSLFSSKGWTQRVFIYAWSSRILIM